MPPSDRQCYPKRTSQSLEFPLILLCHSLRNAIGKENDDVQKKINLIVSNNLREDLLNIDKLQSDANIFVDEFSVHTDKDLDDIAAKLDKENHIWITVAKASRETNKTFRTWLAKKLTEGYLEPSLKFPLRNSKEIVEFENSLAPKLDDSLTDTTMNYEILDDAPKQENLLDADTPKIESNVESKELLISEVTQNITLVQLFDMATQNWPRTELTLPKNMPIYMIKSHFPSWSKNFVYLYFESVQKGFELAEGTGIIGQNSFWAFSKNISTG